MTQATRASWQRLNEYHIERDKNLRKKPVLLVFTKSDLFGITPNAVQENAILEKIRQLGFEKIPQSGKIDQEKLKTGIHYTEHLFSNLMAYLDKESNQFDYLFVSYFSYVNKTRLGINELVEKILPK
jgi:GTPase SAR1 family protein